MRTAEGSDGPVCWECRLTQWQAEPDGQDEPQEYVYHRTYHLDEIVRDGFRDRDYLIPGVGSMRGVAVATPGATFDEHEGIEEGYDIVAFYIPEKLFTDCEWVTESAADGYRRAMIPAVALNQLVPGLIRDRRCVVCGKDRSGSYELISIGSGDVMSTAEGVGLHILNEENKNVLRQSFQASEQEVRASEQRRSSVAAYEAMRKAFFRTMNDFHILFGAGEIELARPALRSLLAEQCAEHVKSSEEGVLDFFDFRSLAYLLAADGEPEAAAEVIESYRATFRPTVPSDSGQPVTPVDPRQRVEDPEGELFRDMQRLRAGSFEVPQWFQKRWPPSPWPGELRVPEGALFGALPQSAGGNVRFVFVGGPMRYLGPFGNAEGASEAPIEPDDWLSHAEDCFRVTVMVSNDQWNQAAILVTHRLLEASLRLGNENAWTYSIGLTAGSFRADVKALTGSFPVRARPWGEPASVGLGKPGRRRWLYDYSEREPFGRVWHRPTLFAINCLRGQTLLRVASPPAVALWRFPDRSDMMLQAFCDTLAPPDGEPVTVVLPDTPDLYDFALRYSTKQQMDKGERTLLENIVNFDTSPLFPPACLSRFGLTRVVEPGGGELDGDLLSAALDFLDTNYQVQISPWDLVHDQLVRTELGPRVQALQAARVEAAHWTDAEKAEQKDDPSVSLRWWREKLRLHRPYPLGQP